MPALMVAPPIQVDEMQVKILVPDYEGYPPHSGSQSLRGRRHRSKTGGQYEGEVTEHTPPPHSPPGRAQEDQLDRPRLLYSAAWPLRKTQVQKHPGHDNQDVHDPKKRKRLAREAMRRVQPLKAERKNFTPAQRRAVLGDDPQCVWCKYQSQASTPEERRKEFDVDHIIAISRGGSNDKVQALRPSCQYCNRARGNRPVSQWRQWANKSKWMRMKLEERREDARGGMADAMRRLRPQPA